MQSLIIVAEETGSIVLPIPAWGFGAIALVVFALLGFVVYSFRDVYHRHDFPSSGSARAGVGERGDESSGRR